MERSSISCTGPACCARHPRACHKSRARPHLVAPPHGVIPQQQGVIPQQQQQTVVLFASKHPDRGASLVRGTQVVAAWRGAAMVGAHKAASVCEQLFGTRGGDACARRARSLLVVHLKDLVGSLFTALPQSVHLLDPIDKVYHGPRAFAATSDRRLCGLVTHSAAQSALYLSKGARRAWVVPDHGLTHCAALTPSDGDDGGRSVYSRRTVVVLGGAPSSSLRAALARWAHTATRRVRILYEKDLRANMSFASAHGWEQSLCTLLQRNASIAVAWDQISGLAFEQSCREYMGLGLADCFKLKPAERFVVPLSAAVPTVGYAGYPSFREAANVRGRGLHDGSQPEAASDGPLLASSLDGLVTRRPTRSKPPTAMFTRCCAALIIAFTSVASADGSLVPELEQRWPSLRNNSRGVLYAPRVANTPLTGDIFSDRFSRVFQRDAVMLHELGASTVVLEPTYATAAGQPAFHQALYNATNFIPTDLEALDLLMRQEAERRETWAPIHIVPSVTVDRAFAGLASQSQAVAGVGQFLDEHAYCSFLRDFAVRALTPAPAEGQVLLGATFGGGAHTSKRNTQAFNLFLLPNDGALWDMTRIATKGRLQLAPIGVVDESVACLRDALDDWAATHLEGTSAAPPVLLTLSSRKCSTCLTPAQFIDIYHRDLTLPPPPPKAPANAPPLSPPPRAPSNAPPYSPAPAPPLHPTPVDGFIVKTSRGTCNVSAEVADVLRAISASSSMSSNVWAENLWFSVGVDAFDTLRSGEYATVQTSAAAAFEAVVTDARTDCAIALLDSVDWACGQAGFTCGVVFEEFGDSFFRAVRGEEVPSVAADAPFAGSPYSQLRQEMATDMQLTSGVYLPCDTRNATDCDAARTASHGEWADAALIATRLPSYLDCDPNVGDDITPTILKQRRAEGLLPPCARHDGLTIDAWDNPAWDGLLQSIPQHAAGACDARYAPANTTLRPRRLYYALREAWAQPQRTSVDGAVTSPNEWHLWRKSTQALYTHEDIFWRLGSFGTSAIFMLWIAAVAFMLTIVRVGWFLVFGEKASGGSSAVGRFSVLVVLLLILLLNQVVVAVQLPGFLFTTLWEVLLLVLFIVIWCPLDGGGGGSWWWVLFGLGAMTYTMHASTRTSAFTGALAYVYHVSEALLLSLAEGHKTTPAPATPFWDPCAAAQCCVVKADLADALYDPWRANVTVPFWWQSSGLEWAEVLELMILGLLVVSALMFAAFCTLQVVWLGTYIGRRPYSPADSRKLARPVSARLSARLSTKLGRGSDPLVDEAPERLLVTMLSPDATGPPDDTSRGTNFAVELQLPLAQIYVPSRTGSKSQSRHFRVFRASGHLWRCALRRVRACVARGSACGWQGDIALARNNVEQHYPNGFQPSVLDACVAQLRGFVTSRARRHQGYSLHRATRRTPEEQSLLASAIDLLEPPTSMTLYDAAAVWSRLTENLRRWLLNIDLRGCGKVGAPGGVPPAFASVQRLLAEHSAIAAVQLARMHHGVAQSGPTIDHWEALVLLLAVGCDNFYRSAPECVNLLFLAYFCDFRIADPKARTGRRMDVRAAAASESSGDVPQSEATSETALYQHDLHDLRAALYELLRYAGGKVGNRSFVDGVNLMRDDYMNFDDLSELCSQRRAYALFAGLDLLAQYLRREADALLGVSIGLLDALLSEVSLLRRYMAILEEVLQLCRRMHRLDSGMRLRVAAALPDTCSTDLKELHRSLFEVASLRFGSGFSSKVRNTLSASFASGSLNQQPTIREHMVELSRRVSQSALAVEIDSTSEPGDVVLSQQASAKSHGRQPLINETQLLDATLTTIQGILAKHNAGAVLQAALSTANSVSPQAQAEATLGLLRKMVEQTKAETVGELRHHQARLVEERLSIAELAALDTRCRDLMKGVLKGFPNSETALFGAVSGGRVFSLPSNGHKTWEERPGYDNVLLNLGLLYRFLATGLCATLFFVSGGQLAFYWHAAWHALATSWLAPIGELVANANDAVVSLGLAEDLRNYFQGHSPNWFVSYLSLCILHHVLNALTDVAWLLRALSTEPHRREAHRNYWRRVQAGMGDVLSFEPSASASAFVREIWRMLLGPTLILVGALFVSCALLCRWITSVYTLRLQSAFAPRFRVLTLFGRLVWLILLVSTFGGTHPQSTRAFVFLSLLNAWFAVFTSVIEALFARLAPTDLLTERLQASHLFGWYFAWYEYGEPNLKPRERRSLKQATSSSLFWLLVFVLKYAIEHVVVSDIVRSVHTLVVLILRAAVEEAYLRMVQISMSLVLRISFNVLFFVANLQLFFALGMAIVGGLTAARNASIGALGSYWDRAAGLGPQHVLSAAAGVLDRFPRVVAAQCDGDEAPRDAVEFKLLQEMWNRGLVKDLQNAHLIDRKTADALRLNAGAPGHRIPHLASLLPSLSYTARRRIHTFISYLSRRTTPVPAFPIHCPSLTVLVPVYSETIIRSWPEMFRTHSNSLTNIEYMIESYPIEFCCLVDALPHGERARLDAFLVTADGSHGLTSATELCDALWHADYLLTYLSARAQLASRGGPDGASWLAEDAQICEVMLDCTCPSADGVAPPFAPPGSKRTSAAVNEQRRLIQEAADLGVPLLTQLVSEFHTRSFVNLHDASVKLDASLRRLEPTFDETRRATVLLALGLNPSSSANRGVTVADPAVSVEAPLWNPAAAASPLCGQVWRTLCDSQLKLSLRLWFSMREQTVWRTVNGLMKALPALELMQQLGQSHLLDAAAREDARGESSHDRGVPSRAASLEGVYSVLVAFQVFAAWRTTQTKLLNEAKGLCAQWTGAKQGGGAAVAKQLADLTLGGGKLAATFDQVRSVSLLHQLYPSLRVAFLEAKGKQRFSVLAGGHVATKDDLATIPARCTVDPLGILVCQEELRRIELLGNPIDDGLAEGKPVNQANALLHCCSEIVMVNDCNQGADLEQLLFLPQLLSEFHGDGHGGVKRDKRVRIVGFKENIFTEDSGIVGRSGALSEFTFGTIIQRELHVTLGARLHYGHPDCFDFGFVLTEGGTSKMSKTINVSEDIFGGINVLLRGGAVSYVDYLQVDKGRDVQYDAALGFEGKISGGTSVHTLSRDFHRLLNSPLTFFHKVSLVSGAFGYFWSNLMLVLAIYALVTLHAVVALLPNDTQFAIYADLESKIPFLNLGFVYLFALLVQFLADRGVKEALFATLAILASIPLTLAKMKNHQYYVHRGLALGVAKYVATGRDLATQRVDFVNSFTRYTFSHLAPSVDLILLLLITFRYNVLGTEFYWDATKSLWLVVASWLFAPALYNPFAFDLEAIRKDYIKWSAWLRSPAFEDAFYGHKADSLTTGNLAQDNWYSWLNVEPVALKLPRAILRVLLYASLGIAITTRIVAFPAMRLKTGRMMQNVEVQVVVLLALLTLAVVSVRTKRRVVELASVYTLLAFGGVAVLITAHNVFDAAFQFSLCALAFTKAAGALLEIAVLVWSVSSARAAESSLLYPRQCGLLAWRAVVSVGRWHAELQALLFFSCSLALALVLQLPLSFVTAALIAILLYALAPSPLLVFDQHNSMFLSGAVSLLILVIVAFGLLGGSRPRSRHGVSPIRFQLLTLNLKSLHSALVLNLRVARFLAENAASAASETLSAVAHRL